MNVSSLGGAMNRYGFTDVSKTPAIEFPKSADSHANAARSGISAGLVVPMGLY